MNAKSKLNKLEKRLPGNTRIPSDFTDQDIMTATEVLYHLTQFARGIVEGCTVSDRLRALDMLAKYHNLTNTQKISTWEDEAIASIKDGKIDFDILAEVLEDESLARRLFTQAGVPIVDKIRDDENHAKDDDSL